MGQEKGLSKRKKEQVLRRIRVRGARVFPVIADHLSDHHPALGQNQILEQRSVEKRLWNTNSQSNLDLEDPRGKKDETVIPSTSGYNLRPRRGAKKGSPAHPMKRHAGMQRKCRKRERESDRDRLRESKTGRETTPKTPAERSRDYRARKRQKSEENQESNDLTRITVEVEVHQEQDNSQPSTSTLPIKKEKNFNRTCSRIQDNDLRVPYPTFHRHQNAHKEFKEKFINNSFGHVCSVCERLWFKEDLKYASIQHQEILNIILPHVSNDKIALCNTCLNALNKNNIPIMAVYNGFKYPQFPSHLPPLDILSERLISPRIPFMQIRRLRHVNGQYGILGQIINVPVDVDTMIKKSTTKRR
ncbi:ATP-dependent DNA helicase [Trichonephila clavipes]|nr:ATP-dependent DNA helicase [Trichonephila clavipes]